MSIDEAPGTPTTLARYLATYITDDSTILAHIKHRFKLEWTKDDMRRIRRDLPRGFIRGTKIGARDDLLVALAKYHLKHSNLDTHERAYYSNIIGAKADRGRAGVSRRGRQNQRSSSMTELLICISSIATALLLAVAYEAVRA